MSDFTLIVRLLGAALLGGIVGYERESEQKPAGLRTIMLVTLGSALVMVLAQRIPELIQVNVDTLTMDPTRIMAALVQGVGFLGAGTIITGQRTVHGLTTAALVWTMSAVGAAAGVGDWVLASTGTIISFVILRVVGRLDVRHPEREL